jgi:hypothetical protein
MTITKIQSIHMKQIIQLLSMVMMVTTSLGQANAKKEAIDIMQNVVNKYRAETGLSFDIAYKYSMENAPGEVLDSLSGQCKIMGDRYWYLLDNTESVKTGDCLVMIFRDDEIMYLAKPSANTVAANPLAMIDSLLFQNNNISFRLTEDKEWQTLTLDFSAHPTYKQIEYRVDKRSGLLQKMTSLVSNELMSGTPAAQTAVNKSPYAIVETFFSNYRQGGFDKKLFDSNRYFKKNGNEYLAAAPFEQYRVFLGSPGM